MSVWCSLLGISCDLFFGYSKIICLMLARCQYFKGLRLTHRQGWKPGYLLLGCQFQFECGEKQMPNINFGLVSWMIKIRLKFWFQFCLCMASLLGFQFRFPFHP